MIRSYILRLEFDDYNEYLLLRDYLIDNNFDILDYSNCNIVIAEKVIESEVTDELLHKD